MIDPFLVELMKCIHVQESVHVGERGIGRLLTLIYAAIKFVDGSRFLSVGFQYGGVILQSINRERSWLE